MADAHTAQGSCDYERELEAARAVGREGWDWYGSAAADEVSARVRAAPSVAATGASEKAIQLIVFFEVTSEGVYEAKYRRPTWPGEQSGVTVGIGYDVGTVTLARLHADWDGVIPAVMVTALGRAVGIRGLEAKALAQALKNEVDVPWKAAQAVFRDRTLPTFTMATRTALANTGRLSGDSFGALVSLSYNRGPDKFARPGDRYREMRAIRVHMAELAFADIPSELRAMKRLWPASEGLRKRREREAALFEEGLLGGLA